MSERSKGSGPTEPGWERPEGFLEDIVDTMVDPLFVKDDQHRWITVNTAFCEMMSMTFTASTASPTAGEEGKRAAWPGCGLCAASSKSSTPI